MTEPAVASQQLGAFMGDLRFLACFCALVLYGSWLGVKRKGLVNMARLGLVVAFGATVTAYAVNRVPLVGLPFTDYFLFSLLALFLALEFLFQMSVMGVFVAAVGTLLSSLHYGWLGHGAARLPSSPMQAYWWLLRDLAGTTGMAALALGLGAAGLLYFRPGRRSGGKYVHPNDLRDVAALLARIAMPCFIFASGFEGIAIVRATQRGWEDLWTLVSLLVLTGLSVAWWVRAEDRRFNGNRTLGLIVACSLAILVYSTERLVLTNLTGGLRIP